jgi:outer membrane biosynthesis protein TonB
LPEQDRREEASMADFDLEMEPIEEGDERQNRTFIVLVAAMGGLLLIGIVAFCAWAALVGRGMVSGQAAVPPTPTTVEIAAEDMTATIEAVTPTETVPTEETVETPSPPPSPSPTTPQRTPALTASPGATTTGTPIEVGEVTPAASPTRETTPNTTDTTPQATKTPATNGSPAQTGIGAFTAVILAGGLLILLVVARRLRTAH